MKMSTEREVVGRLCAVVPVGPAVHAGNMVDIFLFFLFLGDSLITKGAIQNSILVH